MAGSVETIQNAVRDLVGRNLPNVDLTATDGTVIAMNDLSGLTVIYAYPRTSPPVGSALPGCDTIPCARGALHIHAAFGTVMLN